jgi:hypothetical protein
MRLFSLIMLSVSLWAGHVYATTVRALSEPEMVRAAAAIVRGVVTEVRVRRNAKGVIVTDVVIRTEELLKAEASVPNVTLTQLGGTLDGVTLHLPGNNRYAVGEEVLVFLERNDEGFVELGVGAGKYRVSREARGAWVERELGAIGFVHVDGQRAEVVPPPPSRREPLADLVARINRCVRP